MVSNFHFRQKIHYWRLGMAKWDPVSFQPDPTPIGQILITIVHSGFSKQNPPRSDMGVPKINPFDPTRPQYNALYHIITTGRNMSMWVGVGSDFPAWNPPRVGWGSGLMYFMVGIMMRHDDEVMLGQICYSLITYPNRAFWMVGKWKFRWICTSILIIGGAMCVRSNSHWSS